MPIEVKHSTGAAPVAAAAYGGGQGATRTAIQQQQLDDDARKRAAAANQDFQREMSATENTRQIDRMKITAGLQNDAADAAQQRRRDDSEFEYTANQRREHDKLSEEEATVKSSTILTEDEKADALAQIEAKRAGIQPVRRLKAKPAELGGHKEGEIFSKGGFLYTVEKDKDGRPVYKKQGEDRDYVTQGDMNDAEKNAAERYRNKEGVVDYAKVDEYMQKRFGDRWKTGESNPDTGNGPDGLPQGPAPQNPTDDLRGDYNELAKQSAAAKEAEKKSAELVQSLASEYAAGKRDAAWKSRYEKLSDAEKDAVAKEIAAQRARGQQ